MSTDRYAVFLAGKQHIDASVGIEPVHMPSALFDFQQHLVQWACRKGRAAIFADCGLGKTPMQLVWAENIAQVTSGRVIILTPLAVSFQTVEEGRKFGIDVQHRRRGLRAGDRIVVTNYEMLEHFSPEDFSGIVCDESSILKNFAGVTRQAITDFMRHISYRLLCTATAAPNDYIELGTSAEALGVMERRHMLSRFFTHDGADTASWRLKGHAREHVFWRWVCSWARACRRPSDIGFKDRDFQLPELHVRDHVVTAAKPLDGYLFDLPAIGLEEQRADLRRTLHERCRMAADLANSHDDPAVCWTNLNAEADAITRMVRGAVNVQGSDSAGAKEAAFRGFADGSIRVIVSKPGIAGFGLNWQHCAHMTFFPSHSYEQYYQCVRRCWRFGQRRPVTVDMVTTDGQQNVMLNMERKAAAAARMFDQLVNLMDSELHIRRHNTPQTTMEIPQWL